jgi:NADH-quinone oxidoreductase subunit M
MLFSGVFSQAVSKGSSLDLIVAIVGILATVLTAVYGLWTVRRVFFGPLPDHLAEVRDPPLTVVVPLLVLAVLTVAIGIYPSPVLDALAPAISSLLGG